MKRKALIILVVLILVFSLFILNACSGSQDDTLDNNVSPEMGAPAEDNQIDTGSESTPERKIIYSADVSLNVIEFDEQIAKIKASINSDEWFDTESVSSSYAFFVVRVKTERLDTFLAVITEGISSDAMSLEKTATDISLTYQSKEDQITALNEEKTLLTTYLEDESIVPLDAIRRIAEINTEIARLNGELNSFDSLVDYSRVTIRLNKTYTPSPDPSYGERAGGTLSGAWEALGKFFQFLGLAVIAIFPWLLVIVPVGGIVILLIRFKKRLKPFHKVPQKQGKKTPTVMKDTKNSASETETPKE
ncbi:MAG: hypothetical protein BWX72_00805 [Firmicutes bacterium ADurb.Bin080]|nr:DUF4349 domain-containing protein [Clostridiales bacterium]OQC15816.1 MAG: hypothetical protein BWX72_00805 [Firmicutes bacterium ADurb.Bin080]